MTKPANRSLVESLTQDLRRASFTVHACFRRVLADRGLSLGQFVALRTLVTAGQSTTKDLARSMSVTTGNITGLVDKLEAEGLVSRQRSQTDRRVVYLGATRKGRGLMERLRKGAVAEAAKVFEKWAPADLEHLDDLLRRVIASGPCAC